MVPIRDGYGTYKFGPTSIISRPYCLEKRFFVKTKKLGLNFYGKFFTGCFPCRVLPFFLGHMEGGGDKERIRGGVPGGALLP